MAFCRKERACVISLLNEISNSLIPLQCIYNAGTGYTMQQMRRNMQSCKQPRAI